MRLLVTGATGFVGAAVVRHLVEEGDTVSALVRGADASARLAAVSPGARALPGDLLDGASLARACAGADVVVHLAARVSPSLQDDREAVLRVNRDAAVELGEIARRAGARRFVFVSSIAAMGFFSGVATETSPCRPVSDYGRAKLEAEQGLRALSTPDFDVTVLRPPTVYGPGERYNFLTWVRSIAGGLFRPIGRGENAFPLATTANVARAIRAAALGRPGGGTYLVADRDPYPVSRIHRAVLGALGMKAPRLGIPRAVAKAAGALNEGLARLVPGLPTVLTRARVRTLTADQRFDLGPLLAAGVALDAPLEDWVEATVRDYERHGLLSGTRRPAARRG